MQISHFGAGLAERLYGRKGKMGKMNKAERKGKIWITKMDTHRCIDACGHDLDHGYQLRGGKVGIHVPGTTE